MLSAGASAAPSRGSAFVISILMVLLLMGLVVSYSQSVLLDVKSTDHTLDSIKAETIALSGINYAVHAIRSSTDAEGIGNHEADFDDGHFNVQTTKDGSYYTVVCTGRYGQSARRIEAMLRRENNDVYSYAMFAGGTDNDPGAVAGLVLQGAGDAGDNVVGPIHYGGDLSVAEGARVRNAQPADPNYSPGQTQPIVGDVSAAGEVVGSANIEGKVTKGSKLPPSLTTCEYAQNAAKAFSGDPTLALDFIDVAAELEKFGTRSFWVKGGTALQLTDDANPAHIFRKDPNDRPALTAMTAAGDYFLEDPTSTQASQTHSGSPSDTAHNGHNAYHVNITKSKDPTRDGNKKVYFVDGNVWIANGTTHAFVFKHAEADGIKITVVAKGNIYILDNLFYQNKNKDGVALIALAREDAPPGATGNIYIGDPMFGTVRAIDAFLYAQNNIQDMNFSETGAAPFQINGNLSAGKAVILHRDSTPDGQFASQLIWNPVRQRYENRQLSVSAQAVHGRMDIYFDARIRDDPKFRSAMPHLPGGDEAVVWLYIKVLPPTPAH